MTPRPKAAETMSVFWTGSSRELEARATVVVPVPTGVFRRRWYLSVNCWYESSELSHTSMEHGPSSCSLESEYRDLNHRHVD